VRSIMHRDTVEFAGMHVQKLRGRDVSPRMPGEVPQEQQARKDE